jgi:hypothetical protein
MARYSAKPLIKRGYLFLDLVVVHFCFISWFTYCSCNSEEICRLKRISPFYGSVFWTLFIVCVSIKLQRFESWISFRLRVKRKSLGTHPYVLGPLNELDSVLHMVAFFVISLKYRRWTKSRKPLSHTILHHRQKSSDRSHFI